MPGFDRTGPLGRGPMTGRGLGPCGGGARYGRGGGWGGGRGGRGWARAGWGPLPVDDDRAALLERLEALERELAALRSGTGKP
ncbi:MAG: DUF5320 domain-containing protein [Deltaproteobacteria bacterium]|nr:DUF5320 domain-containing protein [Deltaproteobacteria bacterium]